LQSYGESLASFDPAIFKSMDIDIQVIFQLTLAVVFGSIIGLEREYKRKEAGLQTYSLVTLGSCLFTIIGFEFFNFFTGKASVNFDPSRLILAVATGIGFIGAGVIIHRQFRVEGITTAAGLWCSAAIGIAVGAGFYFLALLTVFLATIILIGFGELERKIFKKK